MPIPTPTGDEDQTSFIDRCMSDPTMRQEFSDSDQRAAVCHAQWDDKDMTIAEQKSLAFLLEKKQVSQTGEFEGWASTFGNIDHGGDIVAKGAFTETLAQWGSKGGMPAMLYQHDMQDPIGEWLEMREDERGLFVKGKLWIDGPNPDPSAIKAHRMMTSNSPVGMSIGFITEESERGANGVRILQKVNLLETSVVTYGMNPEAVITDAKSLVGSDGELASPSTVERFLRDAGLSRSEAKAFMAKGYKALRDAESDKQALPSDLVQSMQSLSASMRGRNHNERPQ